MLDAMMLLILIAFSFLTYGLTIGCQKLLEK